MLPNVRLMIAATFASVVVLICGFGVFAAFRVSHDPLVRLPAAAAPLQLAAANAATSSTMVTAGEPFDHRFQIGEPGDGSGISALAYSAPQPTEQPVMKAAVPAAGDHDHDASKPEPAPTPADSADAPTPSQQAAVPEATLETKPDEVTAATVAQAPASAPSIAAIEAPTAESPTEQAHPAEQPIETDTAPASSTTEPVPATPPIAVKVEKPTKHSHDAKTHHVRRARASASAQASTFQRSDFQTASAWPSQGAQKPPAKSSRSKVTAKTTGDSAAGGPFVSAPNQ
jgi:hypothetical protein